MSKVLSVMAFAIVINGSALAQTSDQVLTTIPSDSVTLANYVRQNVYDGSDNKIGVVDDMVVDKSGTITAAIIGVGGFLGIGSKDVAAPFSALHLTQKNNKWYLVMNTTKDALKSAPGFKYDKTKASWVPDTSS